jgi:hypothetical protein
LRKLAVSALSAEPARSTPIESAMRAVAIGPSSLNALDSSFENGERKSPWDLQAC